MREPYPRTERARGYLDGLSAAAHLPMADDLEGDVDHAEEAAGDDAAGPRPREATA